MLKGLTRKQVREIQSIIMNEIKSASHSYEIAENCKGTNREKGYYYGVAYSLTKVYNLIDGMLANNNRGNYEGNPIPHTEIQTKSDL